MAHKIMRKPILDENKINDILKERKIELIGNYINLKTKTEFKCEKGHIWESKPNNILYGKNGCPGCSRNARWDFDSINKKLSDRNITLIGQYISAQTKSLFFCNMCKHEWEATPNNILTNRGCPKCYLKNRIIPFDIIKEQLQQKNIEIVGEFINSSTKTSLRCEFNHVWETTPQHILRRNTSCPICSRLNGNYGLNYSSPGILYFIKILDHLYKIGITSKSLEERFTKKELSIITPIKQIQYEKLIEAYKKEQKILKKYSEFLYKGPPILSGGNSEIFTKNILQIDINLFK